MTFAEKKNGQRFRIPAGLARSYEAIGYTIVGKEGKKEAVGKGNGGAMEEDPAGGRGQSAQKNP